MSSFLSLSSSLLYLLDGLLSKDDNRIHDALININQAVQEAAKPRRIDLLPSVPPPDHPIAATTVMVDDYNNDNNNDNDNNNNSTIVCTTSTSTTYTRQLNQPLIAWTILKQKRIHGDGWIITTITIGQYQYMLDLCNVIQIALDFCPELASTRSLHDGSIALHFAASFGNVPIADVILRNNPAAACIPNSKGKIPLHYAAREGRIELVHFFLRMFPHTASIATEKRKLALHFAAGDGHTDVCQALLSVYPRGAMLPSAKGKLPLHLCARWGHLEIAYELIRIYPDGVRALDWEGSLPIHDAAREGQTEMVRYLLELFPMSLSTANLRNEIPLFPAVRSGEVNLVALLVQAWPTGSKCILQNFSAEDSIDTGWMSWEILELLLRGAVNKLAGCSTLENATKPRIRLLTDDDWRVVVQPPLPPLITKKAKKEKGDNSKRPKVRDTQQDDEDERYVARLLPPSDNQSMVDRSGASSSTSNENEKNSPDLSVFSGEIQQQEDDDYEFEEVDIAFATGMRSKSPVLQQIDRSCKVGGRKRTSAGITFTTTAGEGRDYGSTNRYSIPGEKPIFIPLHASLESSSSIYLLKYILSERGEQDIDELDERGMLPLHLAVMQCNRPLLDNAAEREMMIQMILKNLLQPSARAATASLVREKVYNRLPIHCAILSRADVRVIQALRNANPGSAVDICQTRDMFHDKTPLHMAAHANCKLDVVYELLRADPAFVSRESSFSRDIRPYKTTNSRRMR